MLLALKPWSLSLFRMTGTTAPLGAKGDDGAAASRNRQPDAVSHAFCDITPRGRSDRSAVSGIGLPCTRLGAAVGTPRRPVAERRQAATGCSSLHSNSRTLV